MKKVMKGDLRKDYTVKTTRMENELRKYMAGDISNLWIHYEVAYHPLLSLHRYGCYRQKLVLIMENGVKLGFSKTVWPCRIEHVDEKWLKTKSLIMLLRERGVELRMAKTPPPDLLRTESGSDETD